MPSRGPSRADTGRIVRGRSAAPPLVLDLDPTVVDLAAVGGKAACLARLVGEGLPVPAGCVVTTHALHAAIRAAVVTPHCELAAEELASGDSARAVAAGAAAAAALRAMPLPPAVERVFGQAYGRLVAGPLLAGTVDRHAPLFAVRSSAVDEDGSERSHAGQYESLLNLRGLPAIWAAIREVWSSWYSERAIGYRLHARAEARERGRDPVGLRGPVLPPMAVLVQRLVLPRASGMLFTANPVGGSRAEMALEAGPGLGEALAQGRVHPDYFLIARLSRDRLRIAERGIARKVGSLEPGAPGSGELTFRALEGRPRRRACIDDGEVLALCRLGLRAEAVVGGPTDLEWAIDDAGRVHVVQARPITALGRAPRTDSAAFRSRPLLWTQRFCGERWADQATPLGWSVIQPVLHHFTFWRDAAERWLDGTPPTRLYRGRPYFNIAIFRHLVFRLPGRKPPQVILEMFPEEEQEAMRRADPYLPNLAMVRSIFREAAAENRAERYRYNVLTNHAEWDEFRPAMEARTDAMSLQFSDAAAGLEVIEEGSALIVEYLRIHLLSLLFAHLCYELLDTALRSWVGEGGEALRSALVADVDASNLTLATNAALWDLGREAAADPALAAWFLEEGCRGGVGALRALPGGAAFESRLDGFLERFGHRSSASWEIFSTRWADDPDLVLKMVAGTVRGGDAADPAARAVQRRRDREQAERLVRARMTRTRARRLLPWRQTAFHRLLDLTRKYMALRENQRFSFDRLLFRMQRVFERVGALLERDGRLQSGESIVFLELAELRALASGTLGVAAAETIVARRRESFAADRDRPHPDFLAAGDTPVTVLDRSATSLHGLGISPGVARGTVRVLRSPADVEKLRAGDILVARSTDPGWTPLFLTAGGLVLELGSYLSHGAVVAREYRLPAVVNLEGACRILEDGMEVTVDGDRGRVLVHDVPRPGEAVRAR